MKQNSRQLVRCRLLLRLHAEVCVLELHLASFTWHARFPRHFQQIARPQRCLSVY